MIVEANDLINIFQTCFQVCLAFTVLFFIITVILFFLFDIRAIFNIRTGRAKNKTIKEMQQANSNTGRLRVGGKTLTSKLEKAKKGKNAVVSPPPHKQLNNNYNQPSYDNSGAPTDVLQDNSSNTEVLKEDFAQTELLSQNNSVTVENYSSGGNPTTQLSRTDTGGTSVNTDNNTSGLSAADIHFCVIKNICIIHTDEVIN